MKKECQHHNKVSLDTENILEAIISPGSNKLPSFHVNTTELYFYCLDCQEMLRAIYGIGNKGPAGYMVCPDYIKEEYKKEIESVIEKQGYTSIW